MRARWWHRCGRAALSAVVVLGALLLAACTGEDGSDAGPDGDAGVDAGVDAAVGGDIEDSLDCERRGQPCTLDEVSDESLSATDAVMRLASTFIGAGVDVDTMAAGLDDLDAIAEVRNDEIGLMFRVEGGAPAWVQRPDHEGEPIDGGPLPAATPASTIPPGDPVAGARLAGAESEAADGIAGEPGEGKRGLVLLPYAYENPATDSDRALADELASLRDFSARGGHVDVHANDSRGDDAITLDAFRGWGAYDTVFLATHGNGLCAEGDEGEPTDCHTILAVGDAYGSAAEAAEAYGDVPGVVVAQRSRRIRTDLSTEEIIELLVETCLPEMEASMTGGGGDECYEPFEPEDDDDRMTRVGVTTDFFAHEYPEGLPDQLLMLSACQSMRFTDLATHLVGDSGGLALGYENIVFSREAGRVRASLATHIVEGRPLDDLVADNHAAFGETVSRGGDMGAPVLVHEGEETLRGRDVVALHRPGGGEFADRGTVELDVNDSGQHVFEAVLRFEGLGEEETASAVSLSTTVDGVDTPDLTLEEEVADGVWETEVELALPPGAEPDDPFDVEVHAELPRGGESRWRYEQLRARPEYDLVLSSALETSGGDLAATATVEGAVELDHDATTGEWSGDADGTWARYDYHYPACGPAVALDVGDPVAVVRADIDGTDAEVDFFWPEDLASPPVECQGRPGTAFWSAHEAMVTALVLALGGTPQSSPNAPSELLDFVGQDTVRFTDWGPEGEDGALVYEVRDGTTSEGVRLDGHFRMELRPRPSG